MDPSMIVYVDEAGMDNDEMPQRGWAPIGERLYQLKPGASTQRITIIGGLNNNDMIAPLIFEGYTNTAVFIAYLQQVLIPTLKPGQTVVMDNAAFHKSNIIRDLIESAGCFLKYLPTYSPDLNPIEHYWHALKNNLRKKLVQSDFNLIHAAQLVFNQTGLY